MRKKLTITLAATALLVAALAVSARILIKPDRIRDMALTRARAASDYAIEAGPAGLKFGWSGVGIRVDSLSVISPELSRDLKVDQVDVYVKLFPLLKKQVELAEVVLHRPDFNFQPLPATQETRGEEGAGAPLAFLAMESWRIVDGRYRQTGEWGELVLEGLNLQGGFRWTAETGGEGDVGGTAGVGRLARSFGTVNLPETEVEAAFSLDPAGDVFRVSRLALASGEMQVALTGEYVRGPDGWDGEMAGGMDPAPWSSVSTVLPEDVRGRLEDFSLSGSVAVPEIRFIHTAAPVSNRMVGRVEASDFSGSYPGAPLGVREARATIRIEDDRLNVDEGTALVGEDRLNFGGSLAGDNRDRLQASLQGTVRGPTLAALLPADMPLRLEQGAVAIDLRATTNLPPKGLPALDGVLGLRELEGRVRNLPLREGSGTVRFTGRGAQVEKLTARLGASDFTVNGSVADLATLEFRYQLTSDHLDFNELFPPAANAPETGGASSAGAADGPAVALPGSGTLQVASLRYRRLEFTDFTSRLRLGLDGLAMRQVRARLAGGAVTGEATVVPLEGGSWRYTGNLHAEGMSAGTLLKEWTRAGALLEGTLSGSMELNGLAGPTMDFRDGLSLDGEIKLREGALANLPGLGALRETFKMPAGPGGSWPFDRARMEFAVREGHVVVDTLLLSQSGLDWSMRGKISLHGGMDLQGTLRADPNRVTLPPQVQMVAGYLAEPDGRIPIDFMVEGTVGKPEPALDWAGLTRRAKEKAVAKEKQAVEEKIEDKLKNPLNSLKKSLTGGGNQ